MEMKIVSWNCHYGVGAKKYSHIMGYSKSSSENDKKEAKPDILILQECTKNDFDFIKSEWKYRNWYNDSLYDKESDLGVAIFSDAYKIKFTENFNRNYRYVIPYEIYKQENKKDTFLFYLFAVWTKGNSNPQKPELFDYFENVVEAFDSNFYKKDLNASSLVIGDYNTFRADYYTVMEKSLAKCKLINCIEDEELKNKDTYKHAEDKYGRDDFCFISKKFKEKYLTDIRIENFEGNKEDKDEYHGLSDHVPLTVIVTSKNNDSNSLYNRDGLYTKLKSISSDDFKLKNLDEISELTSSMLKFIGDTDACLRDNLIYIAFCNFILEYEYYTIPQLLEILNIVLDENHLFYDIGKTESDSVFTRSFSVLLVALILEYDNKHKILSADDFKTVSKKLLKYLSLEKDFRAYINGKGWAHAPAHCADALCEVVLSRYCNKDLVREIMQHIKAILLNNSTVFSFEEDERIVIVFMNLLSKKYISEDELFDYVNSLFLCVGNDENIEDYIMFLNVKNFLRSLYFRLCFKQKYANLAEKIFQLERKLNRFESITDSNNN